MIFISDFSPRWLLLYLCFIVYNRIIFQVLAGYERNKSVNLKKQTKKNKQKTKTIPIIMHLLKKSNKL